MTRPPTIARLSRSALVAAVVVSLSSLARTAAAQRPLAAATTPTTLATAAARPDSACRYERCALGIAPRWDGLAVVRGTSGERVATLHFFWPRDVSAALAGPDAATRGADSAVASARRAVSLRRAGAALTDGGVALVAASAVAAIAAGRARRSDAIVAGAGAALLGLSVPFQFAADGALSRAVWWHNVRYSP